MSLRPQVCVVMHQTYGMDNLGSVARVMANFGVTELILSDPQSTAFDEAHRMAVHSGFILEKMRVVPTLPDALQEVVYALGTTSREAVENRAVLSPEAAVEAMAKAATGGKVALVLGGEKRGLSDVDLAACQGLCVIPTSEAQPSMNLAQAAAVMLYLIQRADVTPRSAQVQTDRAQLRVVQALHTKISDTLGSSGYLNPQEPDRILREMMLALSRAELTQREAELWLSAFKHLHRVLS